MVPRVLPLLVFLAVSGPAAANMAPRRLGAPFGEPGVAPVKIAITSETLMFDFRPLGGVEKKTRRVVVDAVYRLKNEGPDAPLEIFFVANAASFEGKNMGVFLDGIPVPFSPVGVERKDLPAPWTLPDTTPALEGQGSLVYEARQTSWKVSASLIIPAGQHEFRVSYEAEPTAQATSDPAVIWQLGYVLAPAREWKSFGGLDLTVFVPPGWRFASLPFLNAKGNVHVSSWRGLPADSLAFSLQAPSSFFFPWYYFGWIAGPFLLIATGLLAGKLVSKRERSLWLVLPAAAFLGLLWAGASVWALFLDQDAMKSVMGAQASWGYGYSRVALSVAVVPFQILAGTLIVQTAALFRKRRLEKALGPTPRA